MPESKIYPFSNGTQSVDWDSLNCCRCKKQYDEGMDEVCCELQQALNTAFFDDGSISQEIATRIGYTKGPPFYYVWDCTERELTEGNKESPMSHEFEFCESCPLAGADGVCLVEDDNYPDGCPNKPKDEEQEETQESVVEPGFHLKAISIKESSVTIKLCSSQFKEIVATLTPGYSTAQSSNPDQEEMEIDVEESDQNDYMYRLSGNRALFLRDFSIKTGNSLSEHKFLDDEFYDGFNAKLSDVILDNKNQIFKTVDSDA